MTGTVKGGQLAAARNKALHGADFYARIGAIGGRKGTTGGFAANRDLARKAGALGGKISRRRKANTVVALPTTTDEATQVSDNDLSLAA